MRGSRAVQVVLGEGEPGILRFILEAEGFHVVGQARGESELRAVLDATHPSVIVLDAGISAAAAIDARTRAIGAQLVVVWPNGVRASVAEERVDPATAFEDLGRAVRRAAERASGWKEDRIVTLPESPTVATLDADERPLRLVPDVEDAPPTRAGRRTRRLVTVAAAWTLALTASAAIGLTVPRTFELFQPETTPRPSIAPSPDGTPQDRSDAGGTGSGTQGPDACDQPDGAGARSEQGRPDHPSRRCGEGGGQGRQGKSRPEDPRGEGNGKGRGAGGGQPDTPGERGGKGRNGNGGTGNDGAGGKGGKSGDEEAAIDDPGADVGDTGNAGNEKGKSSSRGAESSDTSGSNQPGYGPG